MSQTASSNNLNVHIIDNIETPDDLGQGGEMSESIELDDPDEHDDNGSSGDHDQREGADESPTDSYRTAPTHNELTSLHEEKSEHSSQARAGAAPIIINDKQADESIDILIDLFRVFLETASNSDPETSNNNSNPPHTQRNMPLRKRLLGLKKRLSPDVGSNNRYNYEQKYPRDRFGEETAPNARIWLTYLDEAEASDRERVEGWKETVDVLLVFAGLFSGVITTFISQASQSLRQDSTQVTASLLFEAVQILRAQFIGLPINNVPNSTITPTSPFTPSTNASLVNGLWFTSLAITLSAALFAVLAKQWLYYYMASISGTANEKVRARQLRLNGFEQWKVAAIVDLLPILLHLAVGLFLAGIIILLFPLDTHIAWTIVVITSITFTLYFISVMLPIRYSACPYTTSLTIYAGIFFFVLREILRWARTVLDKGFRAAWKSVNFQAQRTIQHLIHYVLDLFRHLFMFISKASGHVRRGFKRYQPRIFFTNFPKFAKWREENIKKAISNATFLDFEAINWLYTTSPDRSVHQMIARCVAVHPTIAGQFKRDNIYTLSRTLGVSETNVQDLRYGLCLDLLNNHFSAPHWRLLASIADHVAESGLEEAEYKSYLSFPMETFGHSHLSRFHRPTFDLSTIGDDSVKLPLAMWCCFLKRIPHNSTMAAHILNHGGLYLFDFGFDPTCELLDSAGLVSFDSYELGWWKFEYLFNYFGLGKPDFSSENESYATSYRLLVTVYRQLTTSIVSEITPYMLDESGRITFYGILFPEVSLDFNNEEGIRKSLYRLFDRFQSYTFNFRLTLPRTPERCFTFFKDILCTNSFWSEFMTDAAREAAVGCLGAIRAVEATLYPCTDYHELSHIYKWCSRDLDVNLSRPTSAILTVLLLSQNRHHLSTILSNDPEAAFNLSTCLRNLGNCHDPMTEGEVIYPLLMDLLKSGKMPLLTHFYNSSVLVRLWELILMFEQDLKQFLLLVKSKLDRKKLDELFTAMKDRERLNSTDPSFDFFDDHCKADFDHRLQASLHMFGSMIGPSQELSTSSSAMLDNDHDNEERAQMPLQNERQVFRSVANWTKNAFGYVWSKPSSSK